MTSSSLKVHKLLNQLPYYQMMLQLALSKRDLNYLKEELLNLLISSNNELSFRLGVNHFCNSNRVKEYNTLLLNFIKF